MINYFSRYVFSYQLGYYGSYLDAFIFHSFLLEQVELYSKQLTYLDENERNFFHNFIYNSYIIYNIKFYLPIQISLDSQTLLILSARPLRGKGCFSITLSSLWLNTNIDMGENADTSFPFVQDGVEKYIDCSNPTNGFARIWCSECSAERFLS